MKPNLTFPLSIIATLAVGLALGMWYDRGFGVSSIKRPNEYAPVARSTGTASSNATPLANQRLQTHMTATKWQEFRDLRQKLIEADPSLSRDYSDLMSEMTKQEDDLRAAMIAIDPKISPILTKLKSLQGSTKAALPTKLSTSSPAIAETKSSKSITSPTSIAENANTLSPDEWNEFRIARASALAAHPELKKKASELSMKLRSFQAQLDAAMLKADPSIAMVLGRPSSPPHQPVNGNPAPGIMHQGQ